MPMKATTFANRAAPKAQKNNCCFLLAVHLLALPKYLKPYTMIARNKMNGSKPEESQTLTYWFAVSHISHPHSNVDFTPTSHQSEKWRKHSSTSMKRWYEEDP